MTERTERLCDWRVKQQPPHELTVTSRHILPIPATLLSFCLLHVFTPSTSFSSTLCPLLTFPSVPSSCVIGSVCPSAISLARLLNLIQITAIQLNNALLDCQANVILQNQKELICKFRCGGNKKYRFHKRK